MKDAYQVVKKLLRTEKGAAMSQRENKYLFDVDLDANKLDVKRAIETIYKVKVAKVNTMNVAGKPKTVRYAAGLTAPRKKAIVTLVTGQTIDLST